MKSFHVIQNIPSPYRLHLFNEMWRQLRDLNIDFHVHFMSDFSKGHKDRPLSWRNPKIDFPHTYWRDYGCGCYHFNPGMLLNLLKIKPTYLLIGSTFDSFTGLIASQCFRGSIKCAWSEGNTKTTGKMTGLLGWIKRLAFSGCLFVGVPGRDAANYIALHQSLTKKKMPTPIYLPNLIDETCFKPRKEFESTNINNLRKELGAEDKRLCIIPARLEWYKGLKEFIRNLPFQLIVDTWKILILGQGTLNEELKNLIEECKLDNAISILNYVSYENMPMYYAAADLFLLPSLIDRNPLTVVEALHSGLPIALSCMAGNVEEGVTEGQNGWVLPVKNEAEYCETLKSIFSTDIKTLQMMGEKSLKDNAKFWDTKQAVHVFLSGLNVRG